MVNAAVFWSPRELLDSRCSTASGMGAPARNSGPISPRLYALGIRSELSKRVLAEMKVVAAHPPGLRRQVFVCPYGSVGLTFERRSILSRSARLDQLCQAQYLQPERRCS